MDPEATRLLEQIKRDQQRTSERMHRDARRQNVLKQASLMLGTGISADSVRDWLAAAHISLPSALAYDRYGRTAPGSSG